MKILLVDDDLALSHVITDYLTKNNISVTFASGYAQALDYLEQVFDCLLIDVMLGDGNGYDLCIQFRKKTTTPVIFLTSLHEIQSVEKAYLCGCGDYIRKPFALKELLLRINAMCDRYSGIQNIIEYKTIKADLATQMVSVGKAKLELTKKEYALLVLLIRAQGEYLDKKQLYEEIWGQNYLHNFSTVQVHISNLRLKLEVVSQCTIKTKWGGGYKLV